MKDDTMTRQQTPPECPVCGMDMIYVDHWEYDGFDGSHEPYWECPDGCQESEEA